jgi:hypothetical protein
MLPTKEKNKGGWGIMTSRNILSKLKIFFQNYFKT